MSRDACLEASAFGSSGRHRDPARCGLASSADSSINSIADDVRELKFILNLKVLYNLTIITHVELKFIMYFCKIF
jgi:hypothetical protein